MKKTKNDKKYSLLLSSLKQKMFKGFLHLNKSKSFTYPIPFLSPWERTGPLPFEPDYEMSYKNKYLSKLKSKNNLVLDIENCSKYNFKIQRSLGKTQNIQQPNKGKKEKIKQFDKNILEQIFPNKFELNKITNIPLFYVTYTPKKYQSSIYLNKSEKKIQNLLNEDFIYKISHDTDKKYSTINNFHLNKSLKIGLTVFNNKNKSKNLNDIKNENFELNINNLTKQKKAFEDQKHINSLEKKLNALKNFNNDMFSIFKKNILSIEKDFDFIIPNEKPNLINNLKKENNKNIKNNINNISNENDEDDLLNKKMTRNKSCGDNINININFFNKNYLKKPNKHGINDYNTLQLEIKKKKFEKARKNAWKEFKRKINSRNIKMHPLSLCVEEPKRNLNKKLKQSYKLMYSHESKVRDFDIFKKLKYYYSPTDVHRILRGLKPWSEINMEIK